MRRKRRKKSDTLDEFTTQYTLSALLKATAVLSNTTGGIHRKPNRRYLVISSHSCFFSFVHKQTQFTLSIICLSSSDQNVCLTLFKPESIIIVYRCAKGGLEPIVASFVLPACQESSSSNSLCLKRSTVTTVHRQCSFAAIRRPLSGG